METTDETLPPPQPAPSAPATSDANSGTRTGMSAEAIIGAGVSLAALGVLFLLLGLAQVMRGVQPASWILLAIGGVCAVAGGIIAASARRRAAK